MSSKYVECLVNSFDPVDQWETRDLSVCSSCSGRGLLAGQMRWRCPVLCRRGEKESMTEYIMEMKTLMMKRTGTEAVLCYLTSCRDKRPLLMPRGDPVEGELPSAPLL